jgi:tRNA(His) guanylyltransferase
MKCTCIIAEDGKVLPDNCEMHTSMIYALRDCCEELEADLARRTAKDALGNRMKNQYENRTRYQLPRRTYTILRLDGKAFHTLTRNMVRPFDLNFANALDQSAAVLCNEVMGAEFAYTQSDEISILMTDFAKETTESWFDGNIQKICSVSAAIVSTVFSTEDYIFRSNCGTGVFDARVFTIPDPVEVENYFIWRQKDCVRNSIQMVAQSHYSHRQLHGKNAQALQDMIHEKGDNWNDYPQAFKNGRLITHDLKNASYQNHWMCMPASTFTQDRLLLQSLIPKMGER